MVFHHKEGEVNEISKERRNALLSGNARLYHDHMLDNDPEYRDAIIADEKKKLEAQIARYEALTKTKDTDNDNVLV
jgi:hypothetical protein